MTSTQPHFIQGVHSFEGRGLETPVAMPKNFTYVVPEKKRAQLTYFRAGNSADELIYLVLTRNGTPLRYFPLGAKSDSHIPLAVLEELKPGTRLEALVGAGKGVSGTIVVDICFLESEQA